MLLHRYRTIVFLFACMVPVATCYFATSYASKVAQVSHGKVSLPFPRGCELRGFGFNDAGHLILNDTGKQTFYLLKNAKNQAVELQRVETEETFLIPAVTAKIDPMHWAAFSSDIEALHFQCQVKEDDQVKRMPCSEMLEVCQYPRVKYAPSNRGNYWVSINKELNQVIQEAIQQGIYLHW